MNEIISGIRVIKMYAWENAFRKLIAKIRRYKWTFGVRYIVWASFCSFSYSFSKESRIILQGGLIQGFSLGLTFTSLTLLMFFIFTAYTANGGELTPKKVFTTLSLLIVLRLTSVYFFIENVLAMTEGRVAVVRLQVGGSLMILVNVSVESPPPQISNFSQCSYTRIIYCKDWITDTLGVSLISSLKWLSLPLRLQSKPHLSISRSPTIGGHFCMAVSHLGAHSVSVIWSWEVTASWMFKMYYFHTVKSIRVVLGDSWLKIAMSVTNFFHVIIVTDYCC